MERPETRYAGNGDNSLAYQVVGDGPADLVYFQGYLSNVELNWEHPAFNRFARVKDLVAGSGLEFGDRGEHVLKGVPGAWHVFAATQP